MRSFAPWLMLGLLVSACGNVKSGGLADAPTVGDSQVDSSPSPLVKATVLTTLKDGLPDIAARLVFQDAAGGVVLDDRVDAAGEQQANLPAGGSVSAVRVVSDTPGGIRYTFTVRSPLFNGIGRKSVALTAAKSAAFTPMTSASVPMLAAV